MTQSCSDDSIYQTRLAVKHCTNLTSLTALFKGLDVPSYWCIVQESGRAYLLVYCSRVWTCLPTGAWEQYWPDAFLPPPVTHVGTSSS